jgi:hypothetical protein
MDNDPVEKQAPAIPATIAKALIKIQKKLDPLKRTATNDEYKSGYVPLEEVTVMAHRLLSAEGVGVTQSPVTDSEGHSALETTLFTGSGLAYTRTTKLALSKADPQGHASAITYMRRYALMAIIGLTSEGEDDDGNKAAGVVLKPTDEQIDRIKSLLTNLRYPKEQIAADIYKIKTRDHAALAIVNYEKIVAMRVREIESKTEATAIEVHGTEDPAAKRVEDDSSPVGTLSARIKALRLASPSYENKVVKSATGKPFMANVKTPEDFKKLDEYLAALEKGTYHLPAEFYAPRDEEIIVDEPVA